MWAVVRMLTLSVGGPTASRSGRSTLVKGQLLKLSMV